ncbi:hypothetical protein CYY_006763 [Polysphondylium violaceum]|uniref:Elongator complex protein 1 n=1 Tax=Polysphondylium violaceum TaxID=133409 RepID=A0A8J4URB6_9MYCE|nr:hypothetical protein CYY_006763 [Polysphondylium violaceum]
MRNITRLTEFSDQINDDITFSLFTIDNDNNIIYFITSENRFIVYNPSTKKITLKIELNQQDILSENATVIAIQYIPDLEAVCMASNKGDILMYTVTNNQLECVGIVGSGIKCMSWSPDYELFILATESDTLVQMTKDWEIVNEVSISTNLPSSNFIPAAFGNKTFGTTSNNNASIMNNNLNANNATIDPNSLDKTPIISWRGDGQFFVVSSFDEQSEKIQLRVWERSLQLHSVSESQVTGLENQISWRPSGSLIAVGHRLEKTRHDIAFFERNGLKHGEFTLREKCKIESMQWSPDSEILALQLVLEDSGKSVIQLWHRSNYYWFLKQELQYDSEVCHMQWDVSAPVLRVLTRQGRYHEYRVCWDYDVSLGNSETNPSITVMVDGSTLKMTPFKRLVVPPPMSAYQIQLKANCASFAFNRATYQLVVLSTDNTFAIYTPATLPPVPTTPNPSPVLPNYAVAPTLTASALVDSKHIKLSNLRHLVWINDNTVIAIESVPNQQDSIVEISFTVVNDQVEIKNIQKTPTSSKILRLVHHLESQEQALVETVDGYIYIYTSHIHSYTPFIVYSQEAVFKFPTPCYWIASCTIGGEDSIVGLNDRNKLYINSSLVCQDCNSFALHNKFLLFTTISHVLRSVSLAAPAPTTPLVYTPPPQIHYTKNYQPPAGANAQTVYDDSIREVERGSRIVAVVPHDTRLVLQMPRGNLEAISPRSLTLSTIREMLNNHQYIKAFMLMRRNRIDLNLIYDHNPSDFLKHIEEFVDQVSQIDYLNQFISSLRDEDTTKSLFIDLETKHLLPPAPPVSNNNGKNNNNNNNLVKGKVNLICDRLRSVFVAKDSIRYNLPILTTYVKKDPAELDQVLRLVQSLRGQEINDQGETIINRLAEESLDYVVFLVDVNKLYDVALGTYDFELVIMVAQKSQKDPKEYMAFLTELQKMEKFYQRYSIDKHLGRWELALDNLSRAGSEYDQDCLDLIVSQRLYKVALDIYQQPHQTKEMLNRVKEIYADHLAASNQFEDAAYLYYGCGQHAKALKNFQDAGAWEMAILMAQKLNYTPEQLLQFYNSLADSMKRLSQFQVSGTILANYCQDYELAIKTYCEGYYWNDAYLVCQNNADKKPLIDSMILPTIQESFGTLCTEIQENFDLFKKYSERIVIVRATKAAYVPLILPKGSMDPETSSMMSGMSGMFSDGGQSISSSASNVTTSSYVSTYSSQTGTFSTATKTRLKKKEKKQKPKKVRITGKEGSPYEEDFLVDELKKLVPSANRQMIVGRTVKTLVLFGLFEQAKKLQTLYQEFLDLVDNSLTAISDSATAILPENKKEKERELELKSKFLQQQEDYLLQQQQGKSNLVAPTNEFVAINIKQVLITREKSNWNMNIF